MKDRLAIIIPAFNEGGVMGSTIKEIRGIEKKLKAKLDIIVVDDGSEDNTKVVADRLADVSISHIKNCGLGAALATGIEYARRKKYSYLITYDADGQHTPGDLETMYKELNKGYDVVIGSRFVGSSSNMPTLRRYVLYISNIITYLFFGVWTTDSQSGFRGLGKRAIQELSLVSNRMEVASEFFARIKSQRLSYSEIPIHVRYTPYSIAKGQGNTAGFGVLLKLLYLLGR